MKPHEMFQKSITILLLVVMLLGCMVWEVVSPNDAMTEAATKTAAPKASATPAVSRSTTNIRGAWISFGDYKSAGLYNKSESSFTSNADKYFKKLKADGINTIYFHVVPCNDAIYPSEFLNWSSYMFKSAPNYDPMEILVAKAHKYKMTFHAWLNPYRKKMGVIFDPGKTSSTNRIVRITKEILKNYNVDGIHFDDYFYPSQTAGAQFKSVSIAKRKAVINTMVKKVYKTVKDYDKTLLFGISPAGNVEYATSLGCDLNTWLSKDGYIDYIIPQIYWSDQYRLSGKTVTMYTDRLNQWVKLNKNNKPMYIGLALYRAGSKNSADIGWSKKNNNLVTQIRQLKNKGCEGYVLFSSSYLYRSVTQKEVAKYRSYIKSTL